MFILNYFISKDAINSIKNPKVKNVFCNINIGKIQVKLCSEYNEEYILEYNTDKICDFTYEEICRFIFKVFTKFESTEYKSLVFDDILKRIIDGIIDSREVPYDPEDDDRTK